MSLESSDDGDYSKLFGNESKIQIIIIYQSNNNNILKY